MTVVLTVSMFFAGIVSLFTNAGSYLPILGLKLRLEVLLLAAPLVVVGGLVCLIVLTSRQDKRLRKILGQIEDKV